MHDFGLNELFYDVERFEVDVVLDQVLELQTGAGPTPSAFEARVEMLAVSVRSAFADLGTRIRASARGHLAGRVTAVDGCWDRDGSRPAITSGVDPTTILSRREIDHTIGDR
jgi:hypothetical protein